MVSLPEMKIVVLKTIGEMLAKKDLNPRNGKRKREKLLNDKIDFNEWMINYFSNMKKI